MRVLVHHRTRGGDVEGVHLRGVIEALRDAGHAVDVVGPPGVTLDGAGAAAKARRASPWSWLSRRAPEPLFELAEVAYNAWALGALDRRLGDGSFDLLYERYALFDVAGLVAARRHGVPLVLEINDSARIDRIRPLALVAAARRVERVLWRAADAIVTVSGQLRDLAVEEGVAPARVHVLPNAVAADAFARPGDGAGVRRWLGLDGAVVLGYVGALNRWRRVDLLVDAFAAIAPAHPHARLLLVGDGEDRASLEAEVARRGLRERVIFAGAMAHAEVASWLAAIDVAVLPHSNDYGSPMKLFEYLAAGCAVVAPWLPPIAEVLRDGDTGRMFAPGDRAALAAILASLVDDPAARARLGEAARCDALGRHVWRGHATAIAAIADALVAEERA